MKHCTRCARLGRDSLKPLDAFPINKSSGKPNSWCKACYAERSAQYYADNTEICLLKMAEKYAANPAPYIQKAKEWHDENRERYNELARLRYALDPVAGQAYYYANRESINEGRRAKAQLIKQQDPALHEQRLQRLAEWNRTHPEQKAIREERRRARKEGLPATWTEAQRNFMHTYWHFACVVCGNQEGFLWTIANDHWIPLASKHCPGTIAENMIPLCHGEGGCNNSKNSRHPEKWLKNHVGPTRAAKILKAVAEYFTLIQALRRDPDSPFYEAPQVVSSDSDTLKEVSQLTLFTL